MGLASIGPISHFIVYKSFPANFGKELIKSFIWGLFGTFIIICSLIAMLSINISILDLLNIDSLLIALSQKFDWLESNLLVNFIMGVILLSFLVIILLELVIFQRIWAFIVIRGFTVNYSFKQKILWVRKSYSKGQYRIFALILGYFIIQLILITLNRSVTEISTDPYILYQHPELTLLHPLMFMITAIIQIGVFLLLISIQIVTFKNQYPELLPDSEKKILESKLQEYQQEGNTSKRHH
jgi:hypothetical protein